MCIAASQHPQCTSAKIAVFPSFPDTAQCVCSIELARGGGSRGLSFFSAHEGDDAFLVLEGFSFFTYSRSPCCLTVKRLCSKTVDNQTNPAANPHHAFHANLRTVSGTAHADLPNSKPVPVARKPPPFWLAIISHGSAPRILRCESYRSRRLGDLNSIFAAPQNNESKYSLNIILQNREGHNPIPF